MREPLATFEQHISAAWMRFQEVVHPQILAAPRISWDRVDRKLMNYFNTSVDGTPWANQLAFLLAVLTCYAQLELKTVKDTLSSLHCRFETIFRAYGLTNFPEWEPETHVPRYMHDPELEDSLDTRNTFLKLYTAAVGNLQRYLHSLPVDERALYQRWALPPLPPGMSKQLRRAKEVQEMQAMRRKAESDAVTPHFARIRGEAHVRWNELHRLRQKFREVVAFVRAGNAEPPVSFSYDEPRRGLRLHFRLWDRSSFVIAHPDRYDKVTVRRARGKRHSFLPERNHYFLEFTGADRLNDAAALVRRPPAVWRYGELCKKWNS